MFANTILAQYASPSQSSLLYAKLYTNPIDDMRMPPGYQPHKRKNFDGDGNPKQHVSYFIGQSCWYDGNLPVKQLV